MKNKKVVVSIAIVAVVILLGIIMVISGGTGSLESQLQKAQKYLDESNEFKAEMVLRDLEEKHPDNIDIILFRAKMDRESGYDNFHWYIEDILRILVEKPNTKFNIEGVKELIRWIFETDNLDAYEVKDYLEDLEEGLSEELYALLFGDCVWGETVYEEESPYRGYKYFYVGDYRTEIKDYTGETAKVEYVTAYEEEEPYKEYSIKYINGEAVGDKVYTGKTKPVQKKSAGKRYSYPTCVYCGYPAASDPNNHPGHGLEGIAVFQRGQNADGSWGFYVQWSTVDMDVE